MVDGAPSREDPKRRPAGASEEPASDGAGGTCAVPPGSGTSHGGSAIGRTSSSIVGAEGEQSAVVVTPSARAPRLIQPPPKMAPPPPKLPPEPQLASVGHSGFVRRPSQGARPSSGGGVACSLAPERFGMADVGGSSAPDSAESPAEDEVWTHVEFEVWVPCGVLLVLCLAIRWQLCEGVAATLAMVLTCFAGAAVIALAVTPRREREMWWARTLFNELPISLPVMVVFFATLLIFFIASRHSLVVSGTAPTTLPLDGAASSGRSAPALATVRKGLMSRLRRLRSGAKANQSLGAADARLPSADSERGAAERWRRVLWGLIWSAIVLFVPYLAALSPVRALPAARRGGTCSLARGQRASCLQDRGIPCFDSA